MKEIFRKLSGALVAREWKELGRELKLEDTELEHTESDYQYQGMKERIYQMLCLWKRKNGTAATLRCLTEALIKVNRSDLANDLRQSDFMESLASCFDQLISKGILSINHPQLLATFLQDGSSSGLSPDIEKLFSKYCEYDSSGPSTNQPKTKKLKTEVNRDTRTSSSGASDTYYGGGFLHELQSFPQIDFVKIARAASLSPEKIAVVQDNGQAGWKQLRGMLMQEKKIRRDDVEWLAVLLRDMGNIEAAEAIWMNYQERKCGSSNTKHTIYFAGIPKGVYKV